MSAEYVADKLMDSLPPGFEPDVYGPSEDLRTGGYFFEITRNGRTYEVLVVETR